MSDILINGMEMPCCCDECRFLDEYGDYPCCIITDEQRGYNFKREKSAWTTALSSPSRNRMGG